MVLLMILLISVFIGKAQQKNELRSFEISAQADGFMCPFLTPKFIKEIQSMDSCKVWKSDDLIIHVAFLKPTKITVDELLLAAVKIGYEKKNISVKQLE